MMLKKISKKIIKKIFYPSQGKITIPDQKDSIYQKYSDFTMISQVQYLDNLLLCESVNSVEGCIVECGVWRGGMIAGISEFCKTDRKCYLFDSFEGLPQAKTIDGEAATFWQQNNSDGNGLDNCKAEMDYAEMAMQISNCQEFEIVKGWFDQTLPKIKINSPIAILRLDSDWYDSTLICLDYLYPLVAENGLIIIDDYYAWDGCSKAIHDYLSKHQLPLRISQTNNGVAYIINTKQGRTL